VRNTLDDQAVGEKRGAAASAEGWAMTENEFAPVTPGDILKEEFLTEYGLSQESTC
jgi:hypothetical protein